MFEDALKADRFLEGGLKALAGDTPSKRENAQLRDRVAESHPGQRRLKEDTTRERRRVAVTALVDRGIAATRACGLAGVPRSSHYLRSMPRAPRPVDPEIRRHVLEVATERPSFGYRRVIAMVRRLRHPVDEKRVRRILKAEALQLPPCAVPRRVRKHPGRQITERPDVAWQLNMKHVWCGRDGWAYLQKVIDTCTAERLGCLLSKRC